MSLRFKRSAKSGEMTYYPPGTFKKNRRARVKVFVPGDEIVVERIEDLPGFPNGIDGWEQILSFNSSDADEFKRTNATLEAFHRGKGKFSVVIATPGYDRVSPVDGAPLARGVAISTRLLNRESAEAWAETGEEPPEEV